MTSGVPLFPSGRQAVTAILAAWGLARPSRVAIPEWSSACLINAVGQIATPVPMTEAVRYEFDVAAVVLYDQWGWELPREALERVNDRWPEAKLLIDKVDTPNLDEPRIEGLPAGAIGEVWSLSKTLGLSSGGVARLGGEFLSDDRVPEAVVDDCASGADELAAAIYKSYARGPGADVRAFCSIVSLDAALEQEAKCRQRNLTVVIDAVPQLLSAHTMSRAAKGQSPGLVPLLFDHQAPLLDQICKRVADNFGIETRPYHFDDAANPLASDYRCVLAFPIHGQMRTDLVSEAVQSIALMAARSNTNIEKGA